MINRLVDEIWHGIYNTLMQTLALIGKEVGTGANCPKN